MIRFRTVVQGVLTLTCCLSWASPGRAQFDANIQQRLQRQLYEFDRDYRYIVPPGQPVGERIFFDYGGSVRFGYYSIDDNESNAHNLYQTDARLFLYTEIDGTHRLYGRLRFLYDSWDNGEDFDGRGDRLEHPLGDEYWYQFDLRSAILANKGEFSGFNLNAKVGRQYVEWATGVSLSLPLYAALLDVEIGPIGLIGLASFTPEETVIDFDASRPKYNTQTQRSFFGGMLEYRDLGGHRPFGYLLAQVDNNRADFETFSNGVDQFPTRFEYNSYYLGFGSQGNLTGNLIYRLEVVHEFGEGESNSFDANTLAPVDQRKEDIDAWAGVLGMTWLFLDDNETRLDFSVAMGTGDDDRLESADTFGGNEIGTDDNAFNSFGYVDTGLALGPELANLICVHIGASTYPFSKVSWLERARIGVDGYVFHKVEDDAPINFPTVDKGFIGGEVDVFLDWRLTSDLTASIRYGIFFPGEAMPDDQDEIRQFLYAGVTYAF